MSSDLRRIVKPLAQKAFSYHLLRYCRERGIRRRPYAWTRDRLLEAVQDGKLDPGLRDRELVDAARRLLIGLRTVVPAEPVLRRLARSARAEVAGRRRERHLAAMENALGIVLKDVPLVRRYDAARELLRYKPAWRGKANLQTMAREAKIMQELDEVIRTNRLPREKILSAPDLGEKQDLIERVRPSYLTRRERAAVVEAIVFYAVGRWRDARDVVLACFVRKARLLDFNLAEMEDEAVKDASRAFMEKSTHRFRALHKAVLRSLETGSVAGLRLQRGFVAELERRGIGFAEHDVYYQLLSGRGNYVRKMAHRLVSIPFEGHDPRSKALVAALPEVFRLAKFKTPVPDGVLDLLGFLDVPKEQLRRRKVFEPIVMMTLADLLWSGRVTVPWSARFGDRWASVPPASGAEPDPRRWVAGLRRRIEVAGELFRRRVKGTDVIRDGRLHIPRERYSPKDEEGEDDELEAEAGPRLPGIDIVALLWEVHQATGFLDAFQLKGRAPHSLSERERHQLTLAVILALGTNIGLQAASLSLGRGYSFERLRGFAANYVNRRTLREAHRRLAQTWDRLGLGRAWGTGAGCSVDGRALVSFERNIGARVHFRRGKVGVTIYWVVRDDHLAAEVRIIGSHDRESWYILDVLTDPASGRPLEVSTGDTHAQHLAAFGLADLLGKRITVRFRALGDVKIYGPLSGRWCELDRVGLIDWPLLRRAAVSLHRVAAAVAAGRIEASAILRMINLYDENGVNVAQALRELGKLARTEFILTYATDPGLRERVQRGCQRTENWNSFHRAMSFGRDGHIETNNPRRMEEIGLATGLLMDGIVFHNAWKWGPRLQEHPTATPVVWRHVRLLGRYRITKRRSTSKNGLETRKNHT